MLQWGYGEIVEVILGMDLAYQQCLLSSARDNSMTCFPNGDGNR